MPQIVPPRIDFVAPPTRLDVPKSAAIKLECRASGNPPPKIVWSRKVSTISIITFDLNTLVTPDTPNHPYLLT